MRVVFAPDSFKGTATSAEAASWLAQGWLDARPADDAVLLPMADGGEGTLEAFAASVYGARRRRLLVDGPDGAPHRAEWLLLPDGTGVVELAATSGITLMTELDPLGAHARGFGQAIVAALDAGATRLLLALGGSASTDGGASVLAELGLRFLDEGGSPIPLGNAGLARITRVDASGLRAPSPDGVTLLADVVSPLLGPEGAVTVFSAQKGADAALQPVMEANLARLTRFLDTDPATPGAGAAGGVGFGLLHWGAQFRSGAAAVGEVLGAPEVVAGADLAVTGEGRFDTQSDQGKVPSYIAGIAASRGIACALVAGVIGADPSGFASAVSLAELAGDGDAARADTMRWLRAAGRTLASSQLEA